MSRAQLVIEENHSSGFGNPFAREHQLGQYHQLARNDVAGSRVHEQWHHDVDLAPETAVAVHDDIARRIVRLAVDDLPQFRLVTAGIESVMSPNQIFVRNLVGVVTRTSTNVGECLPRATRVSPLSQRAH